MNREMSDLLQRFGITWPLPESIKKQENPAVLVPEDCVVSRLDYENRHVGVKDFPDKAGFEHFINHVNFPFDQTKESLLACLDYAASLRESLMPLTEGRRFRVVFSISQDDLKSTFTSTVSFYTIRPNEVLLADDLEEYKLEAVLVFDVPETART